MILRHVHQFSGLEFDWLATDADGFIAMFASAGFGAVPVESVASADAVDTAIARIKSLPPTGAATSIGGIRTPDDWFAAAERGLFAFNFSGRRYELEARPEHPVHIDAIHDFEISEVARRVRILLLFSEVRWIDWDARGVVSFGTDG